MSSDFLFRVLPVNIWLLNLSLGQFLEIWKCFALNVCGQMSASVSCVY